MKNKALEWIRVHFEEIVRIKTSKKAIAFGFAIGTFISILPIPGFSVLIGTALIFIFRRVSKIAIFLAMAIWNPVTLIPIYYFSYDVGMYFLRSIDTKKYTLTVLNRVYFFTNDFLLGNLILAIVISGLSYYITYSIVKTSKQKKEARLAQQAATKINE